MCFFFLLNIIEFVFKRVCLSLQAMCAPLTGSRVCGHKLNPLSVNNPLSVHAYFAYDFAFNRRPNTKNYVKSVSILAINCAIPGNVVKTKTKEMYARQASMKNSCGIWHLSTFATNNIRVMLSLADYTHAHTRAGSCTQIHGESC